MNDLVHLLTQGLQFKSGHEMSNRFMLAPMTNCQSHPDGTLSKAELEWLVMRARGGFSLTMTCAAHVQRIGQGFPGQLGIFSDHQVEGHRKLSAAIQSYGSLAVTQLHHAGMRTPRELINGHPVSPSEQPELGAKALRIDEVEMLRDDFIAAALRAQQCGYDGVEVHGAHGYILAQFLSSQYNRRQDQYGGSRENRLRLILEILEGIRSQCGPRFLLGLRLSPERFGMKLQECVWFTERVIEQGDIDFLDISLWDAFKYPEEPEHSERPLLEYFTDIDRGNIKLTVAGKVMRSVDASELLRAGVDFVGIGRAAILHHDFARRAVNDEAFEAITRPVSRDYLRKEGLSDVFVEYMKKWPGFVEEA